MYEAVTVVKSSPNHEMISNPSYGTKESLTAPRKSSTIEQNPAVAVEKQTRLAVTVAIAVCVIAMLAAVSIAIGLATHFNMKAQMTRLKDQMTQLKQDFNATQLQLNEIKMYINATRDSIIPGK